MIVPKHYENMAVLHENMEPYRCYYIPDSGRNDQLISLRESSQRLQMLSGCEWNFSFYESIYDLKDEFYLPSYEAGDWWDKEYVPFSWQMRGYDKNQYTNIRYPFRMILRMCHRIIHVEHTDITFNGIRIQKQDVPF